MYFRARYYSPQLGQFISRDPLGYVDGMSQYRAYFVPGGVDPWGLKFSPGNVYSYLSFDDCTCSDSQKKNIEDAWRKAKIGLDLAIKDVRKSNDVLSWRRYMTHFSAPDSKGRIDYQKVYDSSFRRDFGRKVLKVLRQTQLGLQNRKEVSHTKFGIVDIRTESKTSNIKIYCDGRKCAQEGDRDTTQYNAAYRYGESLVFCDSFFDKSAQKQAGFVFHEATHLFAGTNDWGYRNMDPLIGWNARNIDGPLQGFSYYNVWGGGDSYLNTSYLMDNASTYQHFLEQEYIVPASLDLMIRNGDAVDYGK